MNILIEPKVLKPIIVFKLNSVGIRQCNSTEEYHKEYELLCKGLSDVLGIQAIGVHKASLKILFLVSDMSKFEQSNIEYTITQDTTVIQDGDVIHAK